MNFRIILNFIGFYFCWWLTIYGAVKEIYFLGPLILILYMIVHFVYISFAKVEYLFIIICFFLGFLIDTVLLNLNFIIYKGYFPQHYNFAPLWSVSLWLSFGLSIFHSFQWLQRRYFLTMILGIISGPIIYYSCLRANIIEFNLPLYQILIIISFLWSFILPLYIYIADYLINEH